MQEDSVFDYMHNRIGLIPKSQTEENKKNEYKMKLVPTFSEKILDAFCHDLNDATYAEILRKKIIANNENDYKVCTVKLLKKYDKQTLIKSDHDMDDTSHLKTNQLFDEIYNENTANYVHDLTLLGLIKLNNDGFNGYYDPFNNNDTAVVISRKVNNDILGSVYISVSVGVRTVNTNFPRGCANDADLSLYISKESKDNYASTLSNLYTRFLSCLQ